VKTPSHNIRTNSTLQLIAVFALLLALFGSSGCQNPSPPRLTAEDRRSDVEFLAQWARDYHPCVEVASKARGLPDHEELLPKYMDLAEQAETNEAFLQVVWGYFTLIAASGHGYLLPEDMLLTYMRDSRRRGTKGLSDIPWAQFREAAYWAKLHKRSHAHAPFRINREGEDYFTGEDWSSKGKRIPGGSQIIRINGMSCSEYRDYLKRETALRYVAGDADRYTEPLLVMNEGPGFRGWDVSFRLPDGSECDRFVPRREGWYKDRSRFMNWRKENCECVELSNEVGYVRIKLMIDEYRESDRGKIRRFLEKSQGRYKKLIIDLRHNRGGSTFYTDDNLIRPFLNEPLAYKLISGVKRKFLEDDLFFVRSGCGFPLGAWETAINEVPPPEGFDPNRWIFYEINREVHPLKRYVFDGDVYVLMDQRSASATETYLDAVKRTGLATLVGQRSSGALGGYVIAPVVRLPASGMICRMEADLDVNPDGSFNELVGVRPDVELPPCPLPNRADRETLLKDAWIKAVIKGLSTPG